MLHLHTRIIFRWANNFHMERCANLSLLNKANIVLIPKKDGADSVTDYKPISLIHSFAKIISKILALIHIDLGHMWSQISVCMRPMLHLEPDESQFGYILSNEKKTVVW